MHPSITCLNGEFLPADRALVPVSNRGFRFGDGVFETIRLEQGVPYQWAFHLQRLSEGLAALRIRPPSLDWAAFVRELIARNNATDGFLRLAVTRGDHSIGYRPQANDTPVWVIEYLPARPQPAQSCRLWQTAHARPPLSALPVNHKLAHGIGSTLALLDAEEHHCDEALQLTPNGLLCSAASANLFWIKNRTLFTPSLKTGCLNGSTRAAVLRLSPIPAHEIEAEASTLAEADAVFLTNVNFGIWPVATLQPAGLTFNTEHRLTIQLQQLLTNDRSNYYQENSVNWKIHS